MNHEMNTEKYTGLSDIYENNRPGYPKAFIDYLYDEIGLLPASTIADIGAGTGKLSRELLARGSRCILVEPNSDMLAQAQKIIHEKDYHNYDFISASAEHTGLETHSLDFITVAQAFHWFDPVDFKLECRRILKPGGKVIIVYNRLDGKSAITRDCDTIARKFCSDYRGFSDGEAGALPAIINFFDGQYEKRNFDCPYQSTEDGFIGGSLSASYSLKPTDVHFEAYVTALRTVFKQNSVDGIIQMPNVTVSYAGRI